MPRFDYLSAGYFADADDHDGYPPGYKTEARCGAPIEAHLLHSLWVRHIRRAEELLAAGRYEEATVRLRGLRRLVDAAEPQHLTCEWAGEVSVERDLMMNVWVCPACGTEHTVPT